MSQEHAGQLGLKTFSQPHRTTLRHSLQAISYLIRGLRRAQGRGLGLLLGHAVPTLSAATYTLTGAA